METPPSLQALENLVEGELPVLAPVPLHWPWSLALVRLTTQGAI
jgi:hypothetical protein